MSKCHVPSAIVTGAMLKVAPIALMKSSKIANVDSNFFILSLFSFLNFFTEEHSNPETYRKQEYPSAVIR
jgi:hypothetical protein